MRSLEEVLHQKRLSTWSNHKLVISHYLSKKCTHVRSIRDHWVHTETFTIPRKTWCASYISDGHVGMYNHWENWAYTLWPNSSTLGPNPQLKNIAEHSLEAVLRNSSCLKKRKRKKTESKMSKQNKPIQKKKYQSNESILIIKMLKKLGVKICFKEKEE